MFVPKLILILLFLHHGFPAEVQESVTEHNKIFDVKNPSYETKGNPLDSNIKTLGDGIKKVPDTTLQEAQDIVNDLNNDVHNTTFRIVNLIADLAENSGHTVVATVTNGARKIMSILPESSFTISLINRTEKCYIKNDEYIVRATLEGINTCLTNPVTGVLEDVKNLTSNVRQMINTVHVKLAQVGKGQILKGVTSFTTTEIGLVFKTIAKIVGLVATIGIGFANVLICIVPGTIISVVVKVVKEIFGFLICTVKAVW